MRSIAIAAILLFGLVWPCLAFEPLFNTRIDYPSGGRPMSVFAADFGGDGHPDLAVANSDSNSVSILRNFGNGTFSSPVNYAVGSTPYSVVASDFDGDGWTDIAVANYGSNSVSILTNNGDGTFATPVNYGVGTHPQSVFAADFNGDGKADLAVANSGSNAVSVLTNNGDGTFATAVDYGVGSNPRSIAVADFDGDGKLDLAVMSSDNLSVLMNRGDGSFVDSVNYGLGGASVVAADFDGDGKSDLAVARLANISVMKNNGDGSFSLPVTCWIGDRPWSFCAADMDGDGKTDLAIAKCNEDYTSLRIVINNGDGTFRDQVVYSTTGFAYSTIAADFDGDGFLDLALTTVYPSNSVSIYRNYGNGLFAMPVTYGVGRFSRSVSSADFDGDGKLDLAVLSSGNLSVLINRGDGSFADSVNYGLGGASVVAADFDGDGMPDLAIAGSSLSGASVLKNNGDGTFASPVNYLAGTSPPSVCVGDFDGDGKLDLAVLSSGNLSVLMNRGDGSFADSVNYGLGGASVIAADFDGDGKPDLVVANFGSNTVSVLMNDGDGTFMTAVDYGVGSGPCLVLAVDLDGDAMPDLAVVNNSGKTVSTLKNHGDGTFAPAIDYGVGAGSDYCSLSSADFDGDRSPDLAVVNSRSNTISILKNNGNGTFVTAVHYGVDRYPKSATVADFDGDGRPDLAVVIRDLFNDMVSVLPNTSPNSAAEPFLTSPNASSATEDSRFVYRATATVAYSRNLAITYIHQPSWLTSNADSIYGTPHYPVHDTSFMVIAFDGFLADTQLVTVCVHQITPEVSITRVDSDTLNLHVLNPAPLIAWHFYDPTDTSPQTEFEVAVGTDSNWAYSEMWNPAPFTSPDTFVLFAGAALLDGHTYYLRLRAYNGIKWSPWKQGSFRLNTEPTMPVAVSPAHDQVAPNLPVLIIVNSADAEHDALSYDFEVYGDSSLTQLEWRGLNVPEMTGTDTTVTNVGTLLTEDARHYWRVRAFDQHEYSAWSATARFWMNASQEPPGSFAIVAPPDISGKPVFKLTPTLQWTAAIDPDPGDTVRYKVELSLSSNFSLSFAKDSLLVDSFIVQDSLSYGTHYWWRVTAKDRTGLPSLWVPTANFWTWQLGDLNGSHVCDLADLSSLVSYLTGGGYVISPKMVGDLNGSCFVDLADLSVLVNYLTGGGAQLKPGCERPGPSAVVSGQVGIGQMEFGDGKVSSVGSTK